MKAAKAAGSEAETPVLSRKNAPLAQNRRMWSAARRRASFSQRKRTDILCALRRSMPLIVWGTMMKDRLAPRARTMMRARMNARKSKWLFEN